MKKKDTIEFYRNLVLTPTILTELHEMLKNFGGRINYSAKTKNQSEIKFDSFAELLAYDNYGKDRIISLTVMCWNDNNLDILIYIPNYIGKASIKIEYEFSSEEQQSAFKAKIQKLLLKASDGGLIPLILDGFFALIFLGAGFYFTPKVFNISSEVGAISYILLSLFVAFGWYLIFFKLIYEKLFPKVVFAIGAEEKRYANLRSVRSGIFWTIIVGSVISLIISYIVHVMWG